MVKTSRAGTAARSAPAPAPDGDTEQRILAAAQRVFVRRGTAGARMQEIADEAGVNKALLHYYFRDKARLALAVFRDVAAGLLPPILAILDSDAAIEEKVERVVAIELAQLGRSPWIPGYVISEITHHPERARQLVERLGGLPLPELAPQVFRKLDAQLAERARAGTLRPISAAHFVLNLLSLCIFPFAARPLVCLLLGLDDAAFRRLATERATLLPRFFLDALRPLP